MDPDQSLDQYSSFSYSPFHNATDEIRLVRVLPAVITNTNGGRDSIVSIDLLHFKKDESPAYDALSYTWGDASEVKKILIADSGQGRQPRSIEITKNLNDALLQIRDWKQKFGNEVQDGAQKAMHEFVWIDALCINQKDELEKSAQVQMMRDIFGQAKQVIICLGSRDDLEHQLAARTIANVVTVYGRWKLSTFQDPPVGQLDYFFELLSTANEFFARNGSVEGSLFRAVRRFLELRWWNRVWVIQEVAAAKEAWIISGHESLEFLDLAVLYQAIDDMRRMPMMNLDASWAMSSSVMIALLQRASKLSMTRAYTDLPLFVVLAVIFGSGGSQATDPRDVFYALSGLDHRIHALVGKVDYTVAWQDLHTRIARQLIMEHSIEFLSLCSPLAERCQNGLPSWVPDWTKYMTPFLDRHESPKLYSACGDTKMQIHEQDQAQQLKLSGVRVARVQELRDPFPIPAGTGYETLSEDLIMPAFGVWVQGIFDLAGSHHMTDSERMDLTIRVATADQLGYQGQSDSRSLLDDGDTRTALHSALNIFLHPSEAGTGYRRERTPHHFAYMKTMSKVASHRRPCKSDRGHLAAVPEASEVGDVICILYGHGTPFVLRPTSDGRYKLLGEAYVHGIMDGEFMNEGRPVEVFTLC